MGLLDFFSLPHTAGPRDYALERDEFGPVLRTILGHKYGERPAPRRNTGRAAMEAAQAGETYIPGYEKGPGLMEALTGAAEGVTAGITAPGRAAMGEPVTYGDAAATALDWTGLGATGTAPAGALRAGPIRAYHGSPHDFDQFSMDRIGTGEGAQVYGHGLYFAENPEVARAYQTALTKPHMGGVVVDGVPRATPAGGGGIEDEVIRRLAKEMRMYATDNPGHSLVDDGYLPDTLDRIADNVPGSGDFVSSLRGSDVQWRPQGRMYEVNIHADPDDFLDWDAPLSEQGAFNKIKADWDANLGDPEIILERLGIDPNTATGQAYINQLAPGQGAAFRGVSTKLNEQGIPGIKYLDQGSRGAAEGTRNYVVFDDKLIEIVRKYGIAAAAPMLGMTQADVAAFESQYGN